MHFEDPIAEQNSPSFPVGIQGRTPVPCCSAGQGTPEPIRGGNLRVVENMDASLTIPTATSYRAIPVKLLEENRRIINEHLDVRGPAKGFLYAHYRLGYRAGFECISLHQRFYMIASTACPIAGQNGTSISGSLSTSRAKMERAP